MISLCNFYSSCIWVEPLVGSHSLQPLHTTKGKRLTLVWLMLSLLFVTPPQKCNDRATKLAQQKEQKVDSVTELIVFFPRAKKSWIRLKFEKFTETRSDQFHQFQWDHGCSVSVQELEGEDLWLLSDQWQQCWMTSSSVLYSSLFCGCGGNWRKWCVCMQIGTSPDQPAATVFPFPQPYWRNGI